jgi:predicted amidophosphoribosyltransferase
MSPVFDQAAGAKGALVLQLHCPKCDAPIEASTADAADKARCWRCGHSFAPELRSEVRPDANGFCAADDWTVHVPAFPGKRAVRLVQRLARRPAASTCPACREEVSRQAVACPSCGRMLKQRSRLAFSSADWRRIGVAILVFIGLPAAVIFFLIVLCAPRGH